MSNDRQESLRLLAAQKVQKGDTWRLLALFAIPLCCLALTADYFSVARYFHGDEAVYYTMAQSLANDGDIQYERHDLERSFERFNQGPQGIVLKGIHGEGDNEKVFYAKPFLYSALIAPLVRFLEMNGAFLGGALFLLACIVIAASAFRQNGFRWPELMALVLFGASASYLYALWIQPELMNQALVMAAYWLWLCHPATKTRRWPTIAALALLGAVTFSKIPTGVLCGPLLGALFLRKQFLTLILGGTAFVAGAAVLFGLNLWATGEWNYQDGNRSIFYFDKRFPYQQLETDRFFRNSPKPTPSWSFEKSSTSGQVPQEAPGSPKPIVASMAPEPEPTPLPDPCAPHRNRSETSPTPASAESSSSGGKGAHGDSMGSNAEAQQESEGQDQEPKDAPDKSAPKASGSGWAFRKAWEIYKFNAQMLWDNLGSFWVGRYSGQLVYWPLLCLLLAPSFFRRPSLENVLIWLSTAGAMMTFLILAQDNYFGGSGTVGNRYFSMMLPPLLFTLRPWNLRWQALSLGLSVFLAAQVVLTPFQTMFQSGEHTSRAPYHWFPLELSLINSVSISNRNFVKLPFDDGKVLGYLPDAGTYGLEPGGFFWTRGDDAADVVLRVPFQPIETVLVQLDGGSKNATVRISGAIQDQEIPVQAGSRVQLPLRFTDDYCHSTFYGGISFLYPLHFQTEGGFTPASEGLPDQRYLGVRVRFTADPLATARAYLARGDTLEAAEILHSIEGSPEAAALEMKAWLQLGQPQAAGLAGEKAVALGADRHQLLPHLTLAALEAGQAFRARRLALELTRLRPNDWWPWVQAARAVAPAGGEALAQNYLQLALSRDPTALEPRLLLEESVLGTRLSGPERALRAGIPPMAPVNLGGVLEVEGISLRRSGSSLTGALLTRVLARPRSGAKIFIHLLDSSEGQIGIGRALIGDFWNAVNAERTGAYVDLQEADLDPELWIPGQPLLFSFQLLADATSETAHVWLGLGLLQQSSLERLPVSSAGLQVLSNRALVPASVEGKN